MENFKVVTISYARSIEEFPETITGVQIEMEDVRAAKDLRISYDFDRDGWKIEETFESESESWKEVYFLKTKF